MPTSSSDDEFASRFSGFFSKIIRIRGETDASVVNPFASIERKLRFGTRSGSWSFV